VHQWTHEENIAMEQNQAVGLDLEVVEVERRSRPGCNSSSTNPRCTCPVIWAESEGA
jgi:hypothetical protein